MFPTTLYRAMRLPNGKNVCVHADYLPHTSKVVHSAREYDLLVGQGWVDHPVKALERLEAEQEAESTAAAVRAADDLRMSPQALEEAAAYEATVPGHVVDIPEVVKAPRRTKVR